MSILELMKCVIIQVTVLRFYGENIKNALKELRIEKVTDNTYLSIHKCQFST